MKTHFLLNSHEDQPSLAITLMLSALLMLGLQDAISKYLSVHITIWQFQLLRAAVNLTVLIAIAYYLASAAALRPKSLPNVILRSLLQVIATVLFFAGAPLLTMTEMAGGLYTFPLFVAALTSLLPGERVGLLRWLAILTGFIGTLLILRPATDSFQAATLLPVTAGFCYALFVLTTRRLCRHEPPLVLVLGTNLSLILVAGSAVTLLSWKPLPAQLASINPYLLTAWQPLLGWMLAAIVVCGVLNSLSNICLSKAYQSAESSMLAPFDYSYLIFATLWGYVFWREVPQPPVVAGMLLISAAGIFVAWREQLHRRCELTQHASAKSSASHVQK